MFAKKITFSLFVFIVLITATMFLLSNIKVINAPLWAYLNLNIVLTGGQAYKMFYDFEEQKTTHFNLAVVGSSHAYRGYDTRIFEKQGYRFYNFGTSGQMLKDSYFLVNHKMSGIPTIIIDIYPGSLSGPDGESTLIILQNILEDKLAARLFYENANINTGVNYVFRMARMDTSIYRNGIDYINYIKNGYVSSDDEYIRPVSTHDAGNNSFNLDKDAETILKKIIDMAGSRNQKVIFVSHPLPYQEKNIDFYESYDRVMKEFFLAHHVSFFNYLGITHLDDSYFKDENHLNQKGVDLFNEQLIRDINKVIGDQYSINTSNTDYPPQ